MTRSGQTLLELVLVLALLAITGAVALRPVHLMLDRIEARNAVRAAGSLVGRARDEAIVQQTLVSVRIDTTRGDVDLVSRYGLITHLPVGTMHGVTLSTTRDSITFDVRGLGFGTANLTLIARRGAARESLVVSRLGRVRY